MKSAEDFKVDNEQLPGLVNDGRFRKEQYAGHIIVDPINDGQLFFWFLNRPAASQTNKTVIWLNGGPGCSSMDGLFIEFGPFRPTAAGTRLELKDSVSYQPYNLLFVDQPFETGFSFVNSGTGALTIPQAAKHFATFLKRFLDVFPQLQQTEFYLAGESFAGQYIPVYAKEILNAIDSHTLPMRLSGLAIGNGWIDPVPQYLSYVSYAVKYNILAGPDMERFKAQMANCQRSLKNTSSGKIGNSACDSAFEFAIKTSSLSAKSNGKCLNMYDIRSTDQQCGMSWPPGLDNMAKYLTRREVVQAIHATDKGKHWEECGNDAHRKLTTENQDPSIVLFPELLAKIPIILFNGEYDFLCNYMGLYDMVQQMIWNGEKGFSNNTRKQDFIVMNKTAGYRYDSRNLGFIVMFNTSHMAGFDAPIGVSLVLAELTGLMGEILKTNKLPDQWTPVSNVKIAGGLLIALLVCFIIYGAYKFRKRRRQQHYLPVDSPSLLQRAQSTPQANDLEMQALRSPSPKE